MSSNISLYFSNIISEEHAKQIEDILIKIKNKNAVNKKVRNLYKWLSIQPEILSTNTINEVIYWEESVWRMGTDINNIWQDERRKHFPEEEEEMNIEGQSLLQCPKCKQYKVDFYTKQTRSADEPETIFANCTIKSCGHRWRS
jgi:DNA-directed RNA polymerase subunit M/transcription elongation factor TFIIS